MFDRETHGVGRDAGGIPPGDPNELIVVGG